MGDLTSDSCVEAFAAVLVLELLTHFVIHVWCGWLNCTRIT